MTPANSPLPWLINEWLTQPPGEVDEGCLKNSLEKLLLQCGFIPICTLTIEYAMLWVQFPMWMSDEWSGATTVSPERSTRSIDPTVAGRYATMTHGYNETSSRPPTDWRGSSCGIRQSGQTAVHVGLCCGPASGSP